MNDYFDELFGGKYSDTREVPETNTSPLPDDYVSGVNPIKNQINDRERQIKKKRKNTGKIFQRLIVDSCKKQNIDCERLKDAGFTGDFATGGNRFTITNIADFVLFNGNIQCWLEAKSTGTSMTFDFRQRNALKRKSEKLKQLGLRPRVMVGVLIEFKRHSEPFTVWWVDIDDIDWMQERSSKKSFGLKDFEQVYKERPLLRTYRVDYYKPARARKDYLDISGMFTANK